MSVGDDFSSSVRASMASAVLDRFWRSAIRRFATGYVRELAISITILKPNSQRGRTVLTGSSARASSYSFSILSSEASSPATAS